MGGNNKKKLKSNKKRKSKKEKQNKQLLNAMSEDHDHLEPEPVPASNAHSEPEWTSQKRQHADDDSEPENEPRRKKKKKKQILPDDADKKNKKSIRQIKKEKFAQRQAEIEAASKEQLKTQCLSYLSQWKHNRSNWKFMKAKQVWLYKNKFSLSLIPNESWRLLMEYFESAQGNIRNMLLDDANKIIKQMDDWVESQNGEKSEENVENKDEENNEATKSKKPDDTIYKRARDLIQCLQEYRISFISI